MRSHPSGVCYGREHCVCSDPAGLAPLMVSVTCVTMSAASCPSRQLHKPSHCRGRASGTFKGRKLEGRACSPEWAGPTYLILSTRLSISLMSGLSAEAVALRLRLAGNSPFLGSVRKEGGSSPCCEEALCTESEIRSECVGSHKASSGLVLVSGMGSLRERSLWALKDLRVG